NYTDPLGLCRTTDVMFYFDGYKFWGPEEGYSLEQCEGSAGVECRDINVIKPEFVGPLTGQAAERVGYWPAADEPNAFTIESYVPWVEPIAFAETAAGYHCQPAVAGQDSMLDQLARLREELDRNLYNLGWWWNKADNVSSCGVWAIEAAPVGAAAGSLAGPGGAGVGGSLTGAAGCVWGLIESSIVENSR
ncbi:MAG: hypothetical protein GY788_32895, partial [bacterium]|nr:hypothetical protein [bacterium]